MAEAAQCSSCFEKLEETDRKEQLRIKEEQQLKRIEERKSKVIPPRYRNTDVEHPDFNRELHKNVAAWSPNEEIPWLGLIGVTGKCKTRCGILRFARFIEQGKISLFLTATEVGRLVEQRWSDGLEERTKAKSSLDHILKTDVLMLDDLGKLRATEAKVEALYEILEERSKHNRPLIWTANSPPEEFTRAYPSEYRDPIAGRLIECSFIIDVG